MPGVQQDRPFGNNVPASEHEQQPNTGQALCRVQQRLVSKVLICWDRGNRLRLSYLQQSPTPVSPHSSSEGYAAVQAHKRACKVVEVTLGSSSRTRLAGSDLLEDEEEAEKRLVAYGSLPAYALLQTRKQMLNGAVGALSGSQASEWWENVLEYSRSISALLGPNRIFPTGASFVEITQGKGDQDPMVWKAIWDLLEIFYVDKHALSWLPERLIDWLEIYDRVLSKTTAFPQVAELQHKLSKMQFPEDDKDYWDGIASALAVGWLDVVVTMLRMHGSYQHNQIDDRQIENGLVEAVAVLISKMPRLRPNSPPDSCGTAHSFKPDFAKAWERWRSQVAKLNGSSFWLDCNHHETISGLKKLLQLLLGDIDVLVNSTYHWMELLVAHFLFVRPFTTVSEGMLGLARKCVQHKPASDNDLLLELILAIMGHNTEVVLAECSHLFDPWMLTHMMELLTANHSQAQVLLHEERHILGGVSLEELHRLVYAQSLSSHHLTWQLAPVYLACCARQGLGLLENMIFRLPISGQDRVAFKVLEVCRVYELRTVSEIIMSIIGVHNWKHGRKGAGIIWLRHAHDNMRLSAIADQVLEFMAVESKGDSERHQQWEGLIDALGSDMQGSMGISFLHMFRDFKMLLNNFQEIRCKEISKQKLTVSGRQAVDCLIKLLKHGSMPQRFWLALLYDSVELLEYPEDVLLTAAEINMLLARLQELSLAKARGEINPFPKHRHQLDRLRLALARNLGRAMLKE